MPKKPLPEFVAPTQASSVKEPFDSPDWIFETKLDGFRAIAVIDSTGKARIWSRNRLPLDQKFPTIRDAADALACAQYPNGLVNCGTNFSINRVAELTPPARST
jgi:bifunctional non-homologous end joining protein LigD